MANNSVSLAINNLKGIDNITMWNKARSYSPQFASHTSEATKELFTERGFESLKVSDINAINEFFLISMRISLQIVNIAQARDPLSDFDFGEKFDNMYGGLMQRMAVHAIKPISPKFKGLVNGKSVDPFVVRKPTVEERFWKQNFDFQNLVTMQDFNIKTIFISEFGVSEFMTGIMSQLQNSLTKQEYLNKLEALNAYINSTKYPLQDSQKFEVSFTTGTSEELKNLYLTFKNIISLMEITPSSSAFNSMGFDTTQEKGRLRMLVRASILNSMSIDVLASAFNMDQFNLGIEVLGVDNFGGLKPFKDAEFTIPLYEVYDSFGSMIGYTENQGGKDVTVEEDKAFFKDPNENVLAVIADKGVIFESRQNGVVVQPIYNPAGLYTNYWMSSPNNTFGCDSLYNLVVVKKASS